MSLADHYPAMDVDSCDYNGIHGNCGIDCTALLLGKCPDAPFTGLRLDVYLALKKEELL